jgi:CheY-like chemotaxis protein
MTRLFLLADDDIDDAELFSEAVMHLDPSVEFRHVEDCSGLFSFLAGLPKRIPDILFLDINMVPTTGWECLMTIKTSQEYSHIPIIIYSTSSSNLDKQKARNLGASGFLSKPTDFRVLVKILKDLAAADKVSMWEN